MDQSLGSKTVFLTLFSSLSNMENQISDKQFKKSTLKPKEKSKAILKKKHGITVVLET